MWTVRLKVMTLLAAIAVVFAVTTGFSRYLEHRSAEAAADVARQVDAAKGAARRAQVRFKIQVQEWKNVLIRGWKPKDFDKYWGQFQEEEARVQQAALTILEVIPDEPELADLAQRFIDSHHAMGQAYRKGAEIRRGGQVEIIPEADGSVRGIDRAPTVLLDDLVEDVEAWGAATLAASAERVARFSRAILIADGIIMLMAMALGAYLLNVWVSRRVARADALAQAIARGELDGETHVDGAQDDLARLSNNLYAMRDEIRRDREAIQSHAQAMRDLLDNIPFGFLLVDRTLAVQPGFTKSVGELVGQPVKANAELPALLSPTDTKKQFELEIGLEQVFDDLLPEEVALGQVPKRYTMEDGRLISIDVRTIRHEGEIDRVLIALIDVTDLDAAERQAAHASVLVDLIRRRSAFRMMLRDALTHLEGIRESGETEKRRAIHTVKGNAGIFGLREIAELAHEIEESHTITPDAPERLARALCDYIDSIADVLGFDASRIDEMTLDIKHADLDELSHSVRESQDTRVVEAWVETRKRRPVGQLLGPLDVQIGRMAERMGKLAKVQVRGTDVRVDPIAIQPILRGIPHLVRNAVDHGLEPPEERGSKDPTGHIEVSFEERGEELVVKVSDDGQGIDVERLREGLVAKGFRTRAQIEEMSDAEVLDGIFFDGFSMRDEVTDVSGRGVGAPAVRSAVEASGGVVTVKTAVGQGTTVVMRVPRSVGSETPVAGYFQRLFPAGVEVSQNGATQVEV